MDGTGRVRSGVCPIELLHLRFFIYRCHVPPPATASAEGAQLNVPRSPRLRRRRGASLTAPLPPALTSATLRSLHIAVSAFTPGATARNTPVTVYLNVPTRAYSTPGTPRRPRVDRHTQPARCVQKRSAPY